MQWLINKLASACENLGLTIILTKTNVSVQDVSKAPELQTRQPHTFDVVDEFTSVSSSSRT